MRGFTTIRDMGGPSFALKRAIDEGLLPGPRIYPSGAMITITSGHGDFRPFSDLPRTPGAPLSRMEQIGGSIVADSPDEVRLRVREQLMQGASQIKLTAGGGVASPFSPLDVSTFTEAELKAAVEAAENWGTYVCTHAYTPVAIQRSMAAGVRCIEHAHLLHAAEIDNAVPPGAKEGGGIQPGLTFPQRAPDQGGCIAQIHPCIIATGLESRDFRGSDDPALHIVAKEYEIVASEYFSLLARDIILESGVVNDSSQLRGRLPMASRRKALKIARFPLAERVFAKIIEDHGSVGKSVDAAIERDRADSPLATWASRRDVVRKPVRRGILFSKTGLSSLRQTCADCIWSMV
jgi:hypothetical protein